MKYVSADQAIVIANGSACTAHEYETHLETINIARVRVSGRYPEHGVAVNTNVDELVYVVSGEGTATVGGVACRLNPGDVIGIHSGESCVWEGNLELVIACSPAWSKEQYLVA